MRAFARFALVAAAGIAALPPAVARANGTHGERITLTGVARAPGLEIGLEATVDPVQLMATLGAKYHLVRVVVTNRSDTALTLARSTAAAELRIVIGSSERTARGVIDLPKEDAAFWDALPLWQRTALRFPKEIGAHETDSLVIAVPASELGGDGERNLREIALALGEGLSAKMTRPAAKAK